MTTFYIRSVVEERLDTKVGAYLPYLKGFKIVIAFPSVGEKETHYQSRKPVQKPYTEHDLPRLYSTLDEAIEAVQQLLPRPIRDESNKWLGRGNGEVNVRNPTQQTYTSPSDLAVAYYNK